MQYGTVTQELRCTPPSDIGRFPSCLIEMQCEYQSLKANTLLHIYLRCEISQPHELGRIYVFNQYLGADHSSYTQGLVAGTGNLRPSQYDRKGYEGTWRLGAGHPRSWKLPVSAGNIRSCRCRCQVSVLFNYRGNSSYFLDLSAVAEPPEEKRKQRSGFGRPRYEPEAPNVSQRMNFSTPRNISPFAENLGKLDLEERAGPVRWYEYSGPTAWPP